MSKPSIMLFDSMARQKKIFTPIEPGVIKLYVCGITVYDYCHIGHARVILFFDSFVRFFRAEGYKVEYVRNITDIDDKIIKRAVETGVSCDDITQKFIQAMHEDFASLGAHVPSLEPTATDNISAMIEMINQLIDNQLAYVAKNGDVCFKVKAFPSYGALARRDISELQAGSRIDKHEAKEDACDFVLWKLAKPQEPSWPSPWGAGRPGWHIECSAMSTKFLGKTIDIHGGGVDLQFPHHENEIAQSEGCHAQQFVRYWMHIGALRVDDAKMSKSLGNFVTIRAVKEQYHAEVIRYFMLTTHYRRPLQYSEENLEQAKHSVDRLYEALRTTGDVTMRAPLDNALLSDFIAALSDDFNTPLALSVLSRQLKVLNTALTNQSSNVASEAAVLRAMTDRLGLLQTAVAMYFDNGSDAGDVAAIEDLVAQREQARLAKDWGQADAIRDTLLSKYRVEVKDSASGPQWQRV